jgi:hypothetical protein
VQGAHADGRAPRRGDDLHPFARDGGGAATYLRRVGAAAAQQEEHEWQGDPAREDVHGLRSYTARLARRRRIAGSRTKSAAPHAAASELGPATRQPQPPNATVHTPLSQVPVEHGVFSGLVGCVHWPVVGSQVPFSSHSLCAAQSTSGVQVPSVGAPAAMEQASQGAPAQAVAQQTPSTQKPLAQSVGAVQGSPGVWPIR